ncbi:hypothetical protein LX36DRAFT_428905 [Colletotrichum falcatum]|nr:hypothetical protein LX36DRAFT_428905 [Colletotrichum falcatum]
MCTCCTRISFRLAIPDWVATCNIMLTLLRYLHTFTLRAYVDRGVLLIPREVLKKISGSNAPCLGGGVKRVHQVLVNRREGGVMISLEPSVNLPPLDDWNSNSPFASSLLFNPYQPYLSMYHACLPPYTTQLLRLNLLQLSPSFSLSLTFHPAQIYPL